MQQTDNVISTVAIATVLAAILIYTYYRNRKNSIPKQWTPVGKVKQLFIYPLKSGRRRELQTAKCTMLGVSIEEKNVELRDRCFVVYGENNYEFKSAAMLPKLILIETSASDDGGFVFTAPGQNELKVKLPDTDGKRIPITLLKSEPCAGLDCGNKAAAWFSQYLLGKSSGVRLGYHIADYKRDIMKHYSTYGSVYKTLGNDSAGLYQNLTSYHLLGQASVDSLNTKLDDKANANNFRPNILVEGMDLQPYAEEDWDWIKIGDTVFRNVKPCARCIVTTVHPENGVLSKTREPLKTLEKTNTLKNPAHIKYEKAIRGVMGIHLGVKKVGEISIGDVVYVG